MSGYGYTDIEPTEKCPYCGHHCRADFCDIGVGYTQVGPYHCSVCEASEIGPYDKERALTDTELKTGWYAPRSEPGSSANVLNGKIVSHIQMKAAYRERFAGNLDYGIPGMVYEWFNSSR